MSDDNVKPAPPVAETEAFATALAKHMSPIVRALEAVREAIVEAAERGAFSDVERLAPMAQTLSGMAIERVDQVPPMRAGAHPIYTGVGPHYVHAGAPPPAAVNPLGDGDLGALIREAMMLAQTEASAKAKRNAILDRSMNRLDAVRELEMLQGIVNTAPEGEPVDPRLKARIEVLLSQLEAKDDDDAHVVPADVLRGHPPDGAGGRDASGVGEPQPDGTSGAGGAPGQALADDTLAGQRG